MTTIGLKCKRQNNAIDCNSETSHVYKRQRLQDTADKPLRYLFIFSHTLIANYEEIMKDSWIRAIQYIVKKTQITANIATSNYNLLLRDIQSFLNDLIVSTYIEDDLVDTLFKFLHCYQMKHNFKILNLSQKLKYDLMQIKDDYFEDNMHKIELRKGMRILLRELKEELKWTLCLIHKDSRITFNLILNDIGLRGYFNAFVCASSISHTKRPYIQLYIQALSRSRIFRQQCMILTNYPIEVNEAIHFGIYPILISDQHMLTEGEYFRLTTKMI